MKNALLNSLWPALIFGIALAAAVFAWWMSLAPRPLPADAPATEFSAYRAHRHIARMAQEPHPGGSHANERNYEYIAAQLREMGVEMTVERPFMLRRGPVLERNGAILARIPGTASTGALAIDAHFDSTPYGPGAADDLSGIAAMLETIRALKAAPPLQNDLLFCFADKEEMGGLGGPGVFIQHPWFQEVRAVLGLETRGTSGPALMFETGPGNGFLIRQLAQSTAQPRATSVMFDFYDRMPFGSDFSRYKRKDVPGLNVAYIDHFDRYHTKLDAPENVSLASLQHHGAYTLGLARQLGNISLENCHAPNVIYFNTLGAHMIVYPAAWGLPITLAAAAAFLAVLLFGLIRRRLSLPGILAGAALYLLAALLGLLLTVPLLAGVYFQFHEHALYRNNALAAAVLLLGAGIFLLLARLARSRVRPQNLLAGALLWWLAGLAGLQYFAPYGAYAAAWPLAFGALGLFLLCFAPPSGPAPRILALASLTSLPAVILLTPSGVIVSYALTAMATPALLLLVLLLLALYLPQMSLIPPRFHTVAGLTLLLGGGLLFAAACLSNTPSPTRPRQDCLSYAVNFDTNEAWWISSDTQLDEWTSTFFPKDTPRESLAEFLGPDRGPRYLKAPAPLPPFGKTVLDLREDRVENGHRFLKLFVDSPQDAQEIHLALDPGVRVYNATAFGLEIGGAKKNWHLTLETVPYEGGLLEIETGADQPLVFHVSESACQLPDIPGFQPRPPHLMCQPNRVLNRRLIVPSNHTYTRCTYTL